MTQRSEPGRLRHRAPSTALVWASCCCSQHSTFLAVGSHRCVDGSWWRCCLQVATLLAARLSVPSRSRARSPRRARNGRRARPCSHSPYQRDGAETGLAATPHVRSSSDWRRWRSRGRSCVADTSTCKPFSERSASTCSSEWSVRGQRPDDAHRDRDHRHSPTPAQYGKPRRTPRMALTLAITYPDRPGELRDLTVEHGSRRLSRPGRPTRDGSSPTASCRTGTRTHGSRRRDRDRRV